MFSLFNGVVSSSGSGYIPEMEQRISQLERGTLVHKFSWRRRSERKTLAIRRETKQLIWTRPASTAKPSIDGALNLSEVKEMRPGIGSKDFDKWTDEAKKLESKCFVVYYGSEFKLRVLSIAAFSEAECTLWLTGLKYLVEDTIKAPYPLQIHNYLRREFYTMECLRETITLKDLKSFFPKKMPNNKLRELFNEVDTRKRGEIGFDDFANLYQKMVLDEGTAGDLFDKLSEYSSNFRTVNLPEMVSFFINEQEDPLGNDDRAVSQFICDFLKDPHREVQEPFLTVPEFLDFLFSKQNDLWDPKKDTVYQDMSKPLSHYWISSSHNTYLTGDQWSSESSVEAYVRCLRMGCRCIELDCWDGPDGFPFIYHGHTLTTKIKFKDVIKTIKEHAFVTSEYPVILSIEDNCTVPQQKKMAIALQEVFGDMLLTQPVENSESKLPTPYALRRKIILKHKKLPDGQEEGSLLIRSDAADMDLRNSIKNGIMYLKDRVDKEWVPHFFVLTQSKLFYFDNCNLNQEPEKNEDEEDGLFQKPKSNVPNEELHFSEKWFHGKLPKGREEAEQLLRAYSHLGDGTFLVRDSVTFVGEFCLSFWRNGQVNHCRIRSKQDKQQIRYYLIDLKYFDSLYSLITHYRTSPLVTADFSITLQEPVPQPNLHENEEWYHKSTGKNQAEEILRRHKTEGAFLVRPSENDVNCYTISFRADQKIKHCRIKLEGRLYTIGSVEFESLVSLINYYQAHPLYRRVKLSEPISEEMVRRLTTEQDDVAAYATPSYMDPSCINSNVTVIAIYDYPGTQEDQLRFCKHAIITNVNKNTGVPGWWKGDYGGTRQLYFPQNYVREIDRSETQEIDETSGEPALLGSLDMNGVFASCARHPGQPFEWTVRISPTTACPPLECGIETEEMAHQWCAAILTASQMAIRIKNIYLQRERTFKIAKELSNLIIYCQTTTFNVEKAKEKGFIFYEMSSFPENKAEKLLCQQLRKFFLKYHQHQFSRVYPKGQRIDSSNYNPMTIWNCGSQMVALNFQTGDKPMQLNQAKFRDNGASGYLLKPEFMFHDDFDPYEKKTLIGVEPLRISIRIIGGRHLCRLKKGTTSPFVEVEVMGAPYDLGVKLVTKHVLDNGLNPKWNEEICEFDVANPHCALLRFLVQDVDVFGEPNFIGQATYPDGCSLAPPNKMHGSSAPHVIDQGTVAWMNAAYKSGADM